MQSDRTQTNIFSGGGDSHMNHNAGKCDDAASNVLEHLKEKNLDELLGLASRYHLGGLRLTDDDAVQLIRALKKKASDELDEGDGKRLETVRVEKQLSGSVVLFFGL